MKNNIWSKYSFVWVTAIFFLLSLAGHWIFAWHAYVREQAEHNQPVDVSGFREQAEHNQPVDVSGYLIEVSRDTLENWQSEFLQLIWQVAGLAFLYYVGSTQSKEGDERIEAKVDALIKALDPKEADSIIKKVEKQYPKS
jgi:hypothetical protein